MSTLLLFLLSLSIFQSSATKTTYSFTVKTRNCLCFCYPSSPDQIYWRLCRNSLCTTFTSAYKQLTSCGTVYSWTVTTPTDYGTMNKAQIVHMGDDQLCLDWVNIDGIEYDKQKCWDSGSYSDSCSTLTITSANDWSTSLTDPCEFLSLFNHTHDPTPAPTSIPTMHPTNDPTLQTMQPSENPSVPPTNAPTAGPSIEPTKEPTILRATLYPTPTPTVGSINMRINVTSKALDLVERDVSSTVSSVIVHYTKEGGTDLNFAAYIGIVLGTLLVCIVTIFGAYCFYTQRRLKSLSNDIVEMNNIVNMHNTLHLETNETGDIKEINDVQSDSESSSRHSSQIYEGSVDAALTNRSVTSPRMMIEVSFHTDTDGDL